MKQAVEFHAENDRLILFQESHRQSMESFDPLGQDQIVHSEDKVEGEFVGE